jgi:hypothetical protein
LTSFSEKKTLTATTATAIAAMAKSSGSKPLKNVTPVFAGSGERIGIEGTAVGTAVGAGDDKPVVDGIGVKDVGMTVGYGVEDGNDIGVGVENELPVGVGVAGEGTENVGAEVGRGVGRMG